MEVLSYAAYPPLLWAGMMLITLTTAFFIRQRANNRRRINSNAKFVITGAGSGLGKGVSRILCQNYNVKLILVDKNKDSIDLLSEELGTDIAIPFCCDLSNPVDVEELSKWVQKNHADVSGLLHFAGLAHGKKFLDASMSEISTILMVNFVAIIKLTRLLLPTLLKNAEPTLLVMSSVAGLFGVDGMVDYCATKHGVRGFCESLRKELEAAHPDLLVCCVCPYFINTGMFAGIKGSIVPELDQDYVAARIVRAISDGEATVVLPGYFKILAALTLIVPRGVTGLFEKMLRTRNMMHGFTGRKWEGGTTI